MDSSVFYYALILVAKIGAPIVGGLVAGALVGGLLQSALKLEDQMLAFAGKICALGATIYLSFGFISSALVDFTTRVWGGLDMYR